MEKILTKTTVNIYFDRVEKIIEVRWNDVVSLEDCKLAFGFVKNRLSTDLNVILNRASLMGFEQDAREWLKTEFLTKEAKNIVPSLLHLATIEPKGEARLFTSAIDQLTSVIYPELKMKSFASILEALKWIEDGKHAHKLSEALKNQKPERESVIDRIVGKIFK